MTVNKSGDLSIDYFKAYFRLVILSHDLTVPQAKDYILKTFFHGDTQYRGEITRKRFEDAYYCLQSC
ncbi:hypothetical protein LCL95_06840 [Bacillus timonensis]|nr:hypothetical protein [Bacillus timonensis]